ncbi:BadM/Rrf2 family transcriptional regulator [Ruminiclostridium sufflavum DSM 19573]|uniref:BadM/Rrf2 family transcriptional regulator n=1 Tax=Ruminiclostridium sufflavum DSM 19573 TaxID=1121337 RepID=A0A318XLY8_9FIRM|nr:Rrf2 family transcriptional regulator [Ruminiclostridium sufflavum]PYG87452.1 BadM/Rrf2 family transcriptional regulator [Ruminiclostridium sufflavum DSM 19573]
MKVSTKGRYGLKAVVDLAVKYDEGQISLKSIAQRQGISENYLEQLFASLKKSGLVKSVRGAQGGYMLSKPADRITVGDVLRSLEGALCPVECIDLDFPSECEKVDTCVTAPVWIKLRDKINEVVDSITIYDLVKDYENKMKADST